MKSNSDEISKERKEPMAEARPKTSAGVPEWMAASGVKKGEFLMLTKAQLKTRQRPGNPLKVQVWATGILHTAGYQGEKAMTMRNNKRVALTPADIGRELHEIAKQFYQQGGIKATVEQLENLKETKETIRRVLSELENEGVCLRTNAKGQKLSELSPEALHRLPSGKTIMYFWLKPKESSADSIAEEWDRQQRLSKNVEVDKNMLPVFSTRKILKIFDIGKFSKNQICDLQFQDAVAQAFEQARMVFAKELEVVMSCLPKVDKDCLPVDVDTPRLPEVDMGGGAFERKVERKENHHQEPAAVSDEPMMMMTLESFHEGVRTKFAAAGKPEPGPKLTRPAFVSLKTQENREQFIAYLTPAKLQPIRSAGVLPDLLQNFRDAQKSAAQRQQMERDDANRQQAAEARRQQAAIENARRVLAHPEEYTAVELEVCREFLKSSNVA